jgi:hypothetical protein
MRTTLNIRKLTRSLRVIFRNARASISCFFFKVDVFSLCLHTSINEGPRNFRVKSKLGPFYFKCQLSTKSISCYIHYYKRDEGILQFMKGVLPHSNRIGHTRNSTLECIKLILPAWCVLGSHGNVKGISANLSEKEQ